MGLAQGWDRPRWRPRNRARIRPLCDFLARGRCGDQLAVSRDRRKVAFLDWYSIPHLTSEASDDRGPLLSRPCLIGRARVPDALLNVSRTDVAERLHELDLRGATGIGVFQQLQ